MWTKQHLRIERIGRAIHARHVRRRGDEVALEAEMLPVGKVALAVVGEEGEDGKHAGEVHGGRGGVEHPGGGGAQRNEGEERLCATGVAWRRRRAWHMGSEQRPGSSGRVAWRGGRAARREKPGRPGAPVVQRPLSPEGFERSAFFDQIGRGGVGRLT